MQFDVTITVNSVDEIPAAANELVDFLLAHKKKTVAFYGVMGAGKTTLINAVLQQMKIEDHSSSPTFSIVNEYQSHQYGKIYHFDFYRLKDAIEALDIGVEEIFEEDAWKFMEWPERLGNLLPENSVSVRITVENGSRLIEIKL